MATDIGNVFVTFSAVTAPFDSGLVRMALEAKYWQVGVAAAAAAVAIALTAAAVAGAVASVKMAGDFQQNITKLYTTAGEAKNALVMVGDGILGMAVSVGTSAITLSQAMYYVESAGFHGAAGLEVLRIAAMGAKAENAPLVDVVKTVVSAMNAYGPANLSAAQAMNTLIAATGQGHMTLADLATGLSNVLPATAKWGISLADTTAAIATMTTQGDNAASAATHLRMMIINLEAPTKQAAAYMKEIGLTTQQVAAEMKISLPGALAMIEEHLGKKFPVNSAAYNEAMKSIAGGSRQMLGYLELTGTHLSAFTDKARIVAAQAKSSANSIMGWADVQANFNFKMDQAKAAVGVLAITVGTALLPILSTIAGKITPVIQAFSDWAIKGGALRVIMANVFTFLGNMFSTVGTMMAPVLVVFGMFIAVLSRVMTWVMNNQNAFLAFKVVAIALGIVFATMLIVMLAGLVIVLAAVAIAVIILMAPIIGIIALIRNWGAVVAWLQGIWGTIAGFFVNLWHIVSSAFMTGVNAVKTAVMVGFAAVVAFFVTVGTTIASVAVSMWNGVVNGVRTALAAIGNAARAGLAFLIGVFVGAFQTIVSWFVWLYNHNYYVKQAVDDIVNATKAGVALVVSIWQGAVALVVTVWNAIKSAAVTTWNAIRTAITVAVAAVMSFLASAWSVIRSVAIAAWTTISSAISSAWGTIKSVVSAGASAVMSFLASAWNTVSTAASSLWTVMVNLFNQGVRNIMTPVQSVGPTMAGIFNGLVSQAFTWGSNIIQGIIDGIGSMLGALGSMASSAAQTVLGFLGFHSPTKEGPGKTADQWGPALVAMFARDLAAGKPQIAAAMSVMVQPLVAPLLGSPVGGIAIAPSGPRQVTIIANFDGREFARAAGPFISDEIILQMGGAH